MKIFVTGATGFLGRHLVSFLKTRGHAVIGISSKDCDLTCSSSLQQFANEKFDQIYHLACWTQAGDFCLHHPGEQWLINQKINTHVLDWWHENQPQAKMIAMGTSCSYDPNLSLEEKNYLLGEPIESLYTYAMTKRMLLCGLKALQKQYGLEYLYLVPSTLYGEEYHNDGRQLHFIFDLIRKILRGHLYGERVVLWGNGEQKRELVHVRDFVQIMWGLADKQKNCVINIGSGKEYSIKEFAELICDCVGYPFHKIEFDPVRYVGAKSKVLVIEKLREILLDFSTTSLKQGIEETVKWQMNTLQNSSFG